MEALPQVGKWRVFAERARLEVVCHEGIFSKGWVLLRGRLDRQGLDYTAKLFIGDRSTSSVDLPVTRKGTFLELLYLPASTRSIFLQPMMSVGTFELTDLSITPVGRIERVFRMVRRIVPMYFKQPRERRQRIGLRVTALLTDLNKAYRLAGRLRAYAPSLDYRTWIERFDLLTMNDRGLIRRQIKNWTMQPRFNVVISLAETDSDKILLGTIESLERQLYQNINVSLVACGDARGLHVRTAVYFRGSLVSTKSSSEWRDAYTASAGINSGPCWVIFVRAGVRFAEHALYWFAEQSVRFSNSRLLYSDHDYLSNDGERTDPQFKPDWSPELLRSMDYIGCSAAYRSDALLRVLEGGAVTEDGHDRLLRVTEELKGDEIRHIPAALFHVPSPDRQSSHLVDVESGDPVSRHLGRIGVAADVERVSNRRYRVRYRLPAERPLVSIIVPTRDALSYLRACIESVRCRSTYDKFEVIVVDNQSSDPETITYFQYLDSLARTKVLKYDAPFNYSAINNFAARTAAGEVLCLLNNDTEVITPEWLEEMVGHLLQSGVGVVGAKLYFSDGRVQHGGDTVGPGGCADHLHSFLNRGDPGYCERAVVAQDLSAVTAACFVTWRQLYLDLGGLDEVNLPVAFNDVDYCLRVRESGRRVVWTPYAELYHHESVSRGNDESPEKKARALREVGYMRKRWGHLMNHDPFYNQNLSYARPDFSLSHAPMVNRPWL